MPYSKWFFIGWIGLWGLGICEGSRDSLFIQGADISFIPQIEAVGGVYRENGIPGDPVAIFKNHGLNWIRLRLWHTPPNGACGLSQMLAMARRIREAGFWFLLDIHYSDTWADPGKQYKPSAWQGLSFDVLQDSVYVYTKRVIQALKEQHTSPDMVQIGNEITAGFLWNEGRVGGSFDTPLQWKNFSDLIRSAIRGIRENGDSIRIMIHIDRGADNRGARWFFDRFFGQGLDCDVIGLSYYPWWHGTLEQVKSNLNDLAERYNRDLIIVETAYPWTLQWQDGMSNIVGSPNDLLPGYPATVQGQSAFLRELIRIVRNTKQARGIGVFYWAPEYIAVEPLGSPWENNALFDFHGNLLPSIDVFQENPIQETPIQVTIRLNTATLPDTLKEYHVVQIRGNVTGHSPGILPNGKRITWDSRSELFLQNKGGDYWENTFPMYPGDQLAYKFWTGFSLNQGTFQRLGWEGPVYPEEEPTKNERLFVAGIQDTVLPLQYYNSTAEPKPQYWRPFEKSPDSIAVYFRVNLLKAMRSGRFNSEWNGPVGVRGDPDHSGGTLTWEETRLFLNREIQSVGSGSFWSGVGYIPKNAVQLGDTIQYQFFIENDSETGWENPFRNRMFIITPSLYSNGDTTLHWVYFGEIETLDRISGRKRFQAFSCTLLRNFPNPFNGATQIVYKLERKSQVTLKILDLQGRQVACWREKREHAGEHKVLWDGMDTDGKALPSGVYLLWLETPFENLFHKIVLIR